jgi:hypothetical protein
MEAKKDISYLGKDFGQFKLNLIDFTKQYFPQSYNDFNESSPGSIFIEMASYVGDVLSYYADTNLKESFLHQATEATNVYDIARTLGYKVKNVIPASVKLDIFQLLPAIGTGIAVRPDYNYALKIKDGMQVKQENGPAIFRTIESVDFSFSSSFNKTDVSVYETDDVTKLPTYYLVKKQVNAVSGEVKTATFNFTTAIPYDKIVLPDTNIMDIISIEESDGDNWYEVPYLAQDTIFETIPNLAENDPDLFVYRSSVSNLLKLRKTSKRFVSRLRSDNKVEIQFGAGVSDQNDEEILPNPSNVGNALAGMMQAVNVDIDPSNFLYTRAYGQAPANTTLTVTYTVGNGITDNVASNVLTNVRSIKFSENVNATSNGSLINFIKTTVTTTNSEPARGAKTIDSISDIKNNAMANFSTQNRLVTAADYIIRCYSLPSKFGSVAKAYIIPDDQISQQQLMSYRIANPLAMNLYVLGYNDSKQLTELNSAVKENLKTYLDAYRMLTDAINIKNAFIINIGIDFKVTTLPNYNSNDVLLRCISALKTAFDIDKWQINQPIIKSDILNVLANIKGVQSVLSIKINNLYDSTKGYSGNMYDLGTAERKGIIYPSLDPSIFEIKYPDTDITGQVVSY